MCTRTYQFIKDVGLSHEAARRSHKAEINGQALRREAREHGDRVDDKGSPAQKRPQVFQEGQDLIDGSDQDAEPRADGRQHLSDGPLHGYAPTLTLGYYTRSGEFIVLDSVALPVEATETTVSAGQEADNFTICSTSS